MAGVNSFTDLRCWQAARRLSKRIFWLTQEGRFFRDRRLVEQINDSSESVMSNIAEGFGRGTQEEFHDFLGYALGSLDETRSHCCAAFDRKYISQELYDELWGAATELRRITVAFKQSMTEARGGVKFKRKHKDWTAEGWENYERITGKKRPAIFEATREERPERTKRDDSPPF